MRPTPPATVTFVGGAGTVTGSKHLLEVDGKRVLLDCGLFQGLKTLRLRNWADFPFEARGVDAVVLSHGHLDHCGALPLLVKRGFRGPIHCTPATADLLEVVLRDAAALQEEDAARANRHAYSKHHPALPLYGPDDVDRTIALVERQRFARSFHVAHRLDVALHPAGHILGAAIVDVACREGRLVFSGDLGRWNRPILRDPQRVSQADVLMIEATYGDRLHPGDATEQLAAVVNATAQRSGVVVVPAFSIGRTQELMWTLRELELAGRIPTLPVFVDSPMAINVTQLYRNHLEEHDSAFAALVAAGGSPLTTRDFQEVHTAQESKALNQRDGPFIVIAGSGMATGGRVLHHLARRLPDARNTVLLSGYQAPGTRGRALREGAPAVRIHGVDVNVRAQIASVDGLSAHADQGELLRWLGGFTHAPKQTFIVHAEPEAAATFAEAVRAQLGWSVSVARDGATERLFEPA